MNKMYTVTATATYFVEALSEFDAENIVHEAMLGNDPNFVLGGGEIHFGIKAVEGYHSTIERGN